ncbi:MAG: ornithine carbamoyltransferase [Phycisphaerales bacterium]
MSTLSLDGLVGRHVLQLSDLSLPEVRAVLNLAKSMKRDYAPWRGALSQRAAVLLFEKPSLRTRVSFEIGLAKLGGTAVYLDHQNSPIGQRETVEDYGHNLERWADTVVARVNSHTTLERFARACKVPVINALSDVSHPCQILADALTLEEHGVRLESMRLAWLGDGNNVCHSLMELAALTGGTIVVVTPKGYEPMPEVVARCRTLAAVTGATIELTADVAAVRGADAVYTDTWISMGQNAGDVAKVNAMRPMQVNASLMRLAGPKALFMHCLPAHRGEEVTDDVIDGPTSVVFDQAENRMHAQNALVALVLGAVPSNA